eukprot:gene5437-6781_t
MSETTTSTSTTTPSKKTRHQAVIKKNKKPAITFKDTVSSPYLNKPLENISDENSIKIINGLKELLSLDLELGQSLKENKLKSWSLINKEKQQIAITKKKLTTIEKSVPNIKDEKSKQSKIDQCKSAIEQSENKIKQIIQDKQEKKQELKRKFDDQQQKHQQGGGGEGDKEQRIFRLKKEFILGVNAITKEMEKTPIHSLPNIRLIIVCPNPDLLQMTAHLPIMAFMRRIPIILLPYTYSNEFSQSVGLNSTLAIAIKTTDLSSTSTNKDNNNNKDREFKDDFDDKLDEFVHLGCEASKSIPPIDLPWLPHKFTQANLGKPLDVKYTPVNIVKTGNKRKKIN